MTCTGVYYVSISPEVLKAVLLVTWNTHVEHCSVAWLVSFVLAEALSLCTVWCLFHDGVIVSGTEGKQLHVEGYVRQK